MPLVRAIGKDIPACGNSGNTEMSTCDAFLTAELVKTKRDLSLCASQIPINRAMNEQN